MKRLSEVYGRRFGMYIAGVLLALGIVTWLSGAEPVEAAQKIPISSVEDLRNMENDPDGSYYLTKDIKLPKNMEGLFATPYYNGTSEPFTGTLDGRGHKLKGFTCHAGDDGEYKVVSLFYVASGATFKNLTLSDVDIDVNSGTEFAFVSALVESARECKFSKVRVSGKITVKGNNRDKEGTHCEVGGLARETRGCSFTDCSNSLKIKVSCKNLRKLRVGGFAAYMYSSPVEKNCRFSGSVQVSCTATPDMYKYGYLVAGHGAELSDARFTGCVNSGNVTLKLKKVKGYDDTVGGVNVAGLANGSANMTGCGNSGNIKVYAPDIEDIVMGFGLLAGVSSIKEDNNTDYLTRCWNSGRVSATGGRRTFAGGLCKKAHRIRECYNKGTIYAKGEKGPTNYPSEAAGLAIEAWRVNNCYNVGDITVKGAGKAGGLVKLVEVDGNCTGNYSTGKVKSNAFGGYDTSAALFYSGGVKAMMENKTFCFNNYYKSGYPYGQGGEGGEYGIAKQLSTKVSQITSQSCPKLSSKYWIYSSKYKRLVLKNNQEK